MRRNQSPETNEKLLNDAWNEFRRGARIVIGFSIVVNILLLVQPIYMLQVYDRVLTSQSRDTLLYLTLIAVGLIGIFAALDQVRRSLMTRLSARFEQRMAEDTLMACLEASSVQRINGAQVLRDLNTIRNFIGGNGIIPLFDAPWAPLFLATIWLLHPTLGLIATGAAALILLVALVNAAVSRKLEVESGNLLLKSMAFAEGAIKNSVAVRSMGMTPGILDRWEGARKEHLDISLRSDKRTQTLGALSRFLRIGTQVIILGGGALLVLRGEMTPGGMIAASILLGRALQPLEQGIQSWRGYVGMREADGRVRSLLQQIPIKADRIILPEPKGNLKVEQLIYHPPNAPEPILKRISFEVKPGEFVGLIGPSASGKSTLCNLLVGVTRPSYGSVRLDGAELHNYDPDQLGSAIGYLPQEVELFGGTVSDNISRFKEAESQTIIEAAQRANAHDIILNLPEGYRTVIDQDGYRLSGGQRQRVGLARAFFGSPALVVLDEPNANLDSDGESALVEAMGHIKRLGATLIVVSHRPSILRHADKLLFLNQGFVEKYGPRDEVMEYIQRQRAASAGGNTAIPGQPGVRQIQS